MSRLALPLFVRTGRQMREGPGRALREIAEHGERVFEFAYAGGEDIDPGPLVEESDTPVTLGLSSDPGKRRGKETLPAPVDAVCDAWSGGGPLAALVCSSNEEERSAARPPRGV